MVTTVTPAPYQASTHLPVVWQLWVMPTWPQIKGLLLVGGPKSISLKTLLVRGRGL